MNRQIQLKSSSTAELPATGNPLTMFPSKSSSLASVFYAVDVPKNKKKYAHNKRWLDPEITDPNFGLEEQQQESKFRRTFRRIGSNALFNPPRADSVSFKELQIPPKLPNKKFILVEEDRISELVKFEKILANERELLGEQCAWLMSDVSLSARIPVPAVRLAMHNLCEAEMRKYAQEMKILSEKWAVHCKQNHYDRPHIFPKDSYVNIAPLAQRAMKLRLMKEAQEVYRYRLNRDSMAYEDDLSRISNKYLDAKERKVDYDRYYILATRYGYFTEEEFKKDLNPGRRYWRRAVTGALKFQHLWDRYYSVRKLVIYKGARYIQKMWRGHAAYKKNHPMIMLSLRIGKRSYYKFCWKRWHEYLKILSFMKSTLLYLTSNWMRKCFFVWMKWAKEQKAHKNAIMNRFVMRIKYGLVAVIMLAWHTWAKSRKKAALYIYRLLNNPFFGRWVEYTQYSKHMKRLNKMASRMGALGLMYIQRRLFKRKKAAVKKLYGLASIIFARNIASRKREAIIDKEFVEHLPAELERKQAKAIEAERRRLVRQQQQATEKEKIAIRDLRAHLATKDGMLQLKKLRNKLNDDRKSSGVSSYQEASELAEVQLLTETSDVVRAYAIHDYNVKSGPFIRCPDPGCHTICTTEEQYRMHLKNSKYHIDRNTPDYSTFNLMLRNIRGQEYIRNFIIRTQGIGEISHCIDCWASIMEWKKVTSKTEQYSVKINNIFETYLTKDASRPIYDILSPVCKTYLDSLRIKLQKYKQRKYNGFFVEATDDVSLIRRALGWNGKVYTKWSMDNSFSPTNMDELEWYLFYTIYVNVFCNDSVRTPIKAGLVDKPKPAPLKSSKKGKKKPENKDQHVIETPIVDQMLCMMTTQDKLSRGMTVFEQSVEYQGYLDVLALEAANKQAVLREEYKILRMNKILEWALQCKHKEIAMAEKALEVTRAIEDAEVDRLLNYLLRTGVRIRQCEIMHDEQIPVEFEAALVEDCTSNAEESIIDDVYEYYVSALLVQMLEIPECRKGMLEYAGLLTGALKRKLLVDMSRQNEGKEWFDKFFNETQNAEKSEMELDVVGAAVRIQKRVRGMIGRKAVRKLYAATFVKK